MKHILEDGRWLLASYNDIQEFFSLNNVVGKTIAEIRPYCLDYMIQNITEIDDFENNWTESSVDTDGKICILFEDKTNLEIEYSGEGPLLLGYNTADLNTYPVNDGSCYSLQTLFQYCIGYKIVGIHFEKSDHKMLFPAYRGIDMSADDDGINEIRFALCGGTTLMASGSGDYFSFKHFMDFGGLVYVRISDLISELNEATYEHYFGEWEREKEKAEFAEDRWERFSAIETHYDEYDNIEYGQFGFKDNAGNIVIEPQFWATSEFYRGLCAVAIKGPKVTPPDGRNYVQELWGYIDKTGKAVIPFRFVKACDFNRYGVAVVQDEWYGDYYLIDTRGKEIPGSRYRYMETFGEHDDRYLEFSNVDPEADNNIGLYDTKLRRVLLEPKFGSATVLSDDLIKISETGELGHVDTYDRYINSKCEDIYPGLVNKGFNGVNKPNPYGHVIVSIRTHYEVDQSVWHWNPVFGKKYWCNVKLGVVDLEGNILIPIEYDSIHDNQDGSFECVQGDNKMIIRLV